MIPREQAVEMLHDAALRGRVDLLQQVFTQCENISVDAPNKVGYDVLYMDTCSPD